LSTAGAERPAPARAHLVPAEGHLVHAKADLVPAEEQLEGTEQLVPAEAHLVLAMADLVPAEEQLKATVRLVPAKADLVPAEETLVPTRTWPADTARKRTSLVVAEGSGPVLPSKPEAGVTAVHAGATRPVKGAKALASPLRHASMPTPAGE
jgi:hypothetical protein